MREQLRRIREAINGWLSEQAAREQAVRANIGAGI
jgi:hypothetical protein